MPLEVYDLLSLAEALSRPIAEQCRRPLRVLLAGTPLVCTRCLGRCIDLLPLRPLESSASRPTREGERIDASRLGPCRPDCVRTSVSLGAVSRSSLQTTREEGDRAVENRRR